MLRCCLTNFRTQLSRLRSPRCPTVHLSRFSFVGEDDDMDATGRLEGILNRLNKTMGTETAQTKQPLKQPTQVPEQSRQKEALPASTVSPEFKWKDPFGEGNVEIPIETHVDSEMDFGKMAGDHLWGESLPGETASKGFEIESTSAVPQMPTRAPQRAPEPEQSGAPEFSSRFEQQRLSGDFDFQQSTESGTEKRIEKEEIRNFPDFSATRSGQPLQRSAEERQWAQQSSSQPPSAALRMYGRVPQLSEETRRKVVAEMDAAAKQPQNVDDVFPQSIRFDDEIEQWIYDCIRQCQGEMLPLPEEISAHFGATLSIAQAKECRSAVVERLMAELPSANCDDGATGAQRNAEEITLKPDRFEKHWPPRNHFSRIGSHYGSLNPFETCAENNPLDSFVHPKWDFEGSDSFDANWQPFGVNLVGLNPASACGMDNKVWDSLEDSGRLVQRIDSPHAKFSTLLVNNTHTAVATDTGLLEELRRQLSAVNKDYTTVATAITGRNRREYLPSAQWSDLISAHEIGLTQMTSQFMDSMFGLCADTVTMCKPVIVATHGIVRNAQIPPLINASARMCDAGTRLVFDFCKLGMVPFGGVFYRAQMCPLHLRGALAWHLLSGQPMNAYDALEMGFMDWIIAPNSVSMLAKIGREVDAVFLKEFATQDTIRRRAMLKNIIELYDAGLERFRAPFSEESLHAEMSALFHDNDASVHFDHSHFVDFNKFWSNLNAGCNGELNGLHFENETEMKASVRRFRTLLASMREASPLALRLTYTMLRAVFHKSADYSYLELMSVEWNALHWLMHCGDLFQGLAVASGSVHKAQWCHRGSALFDDISDLDSDKRLSELKRVGDKWFTELQYFAEPPSDVSETWSRSLLQRSQFSQVLAPIHSVLNATGEWQHGFSGEQWFHRMTTQSLADFSMLRGAVPPFVDSLLRKELGHSWRLLRLNQGRTRTCSKVTRRALGLQQS